MTYLAQHVDVDMWFNIFGLTEYQPLRVDQNADPQTHQTPRSQV